jgi:hypothetical protein
MNTAHRTLSSSSKAPPSLMPVTRPVLQRKCACGDHTMGGECEECHKKRDGTLQRASLPARGRRPEGEWEVRSIVHEVLRSPGQSLDATTRGYMEPRFGRDFSNVRVHAGHEAADSAREISARAYTVGNDIVFGEGAWLIHVAGRWEHARTRKSARRGAL